MKRPLLYTFRRCPYAMRARLAIWVTQTECELREVVLRDKPPSLIEFSPKATVPVLVLDDGTVIDESLDVMLWALRRQDPDGWLTPTQGGLDEILALVEANDHDFKRHLDRYKYPNRYDDPDPVYHREQAEKFLSLLDDKLTKETYLFGSKISLADAAIGPFVRQFANTNREWFDATPYKALKAWLERFLSWPLFLAIMSKYPQWHNGDEPTYAP